MQLLWADQGYTGGGKAWIEEQLGWHVEIVQHAPHPRGQWRVVTDPDDPTSAHFEWFLNPRDVELLARSVEMLRRGRGATIALSAWASASASFATVASAACTGVQAAPVPPPAAGSDAWLRYRLLPSVEESTVQAAPDGVIGMRKEDVAPDPATGAGQPPALRQPLSRPEANLGGEVAIPRRPGFRRCGWTTGDPSRRHDAVPSFFTAPSRPRAPAWDSAGATRHV